MGLMRAVAILGSLILCPWLALGGQVGSFDPVSPADEEETWTGSGVLLDSDLVQISTYKILLVNRRLSETQVMSILTMTPNGEPPVVVRCVVTLGGLKNTTQCNVGSGVQIALGSIIQATFQLADGSVLESAAALDDGGERQRVIRRRFMDDQVITYARESLQRTP